MRRSPSVNKYAHLVHFKTGRGRKIIDDPRDETPMSIEKAKAWRHQTRIDPWNKAHMYFSTGSLLAAAGYKSEIVEYKDISDEMWKAISKNIPKIEAREICFRNMLLHHNRGRVSFVHTQPPVVVPSMRKLSLVSSWTLFSKCLSCGGNRWAPIMMNGQEHVACWGCIPPSQYPAFGASALEKRHLIDEALEKYY